MQLLNTRWLDLREVPNRFLSENIPLYWFPFFVNRIVKGIVPIAWAERLVRVWRQAASVWALLGVVSFIPQGPAHSNHSPASSSGSKPEVEGWPGAGVGAG